MSRKLLRDETGMTMGITLVMILLISVMGAGLLTFVMRDIDSVIETNRGQRAMDIADAGVQAAKAHLRVDSFRGHYDTDEANDCVEGIRVGSDNWSKAADIYTDPNGYCVGPSTRTDVGSTPWPEDQGVTKLFGGGRMHVTIECYQQTDTVCSGGVPGSPEQNVDAAEKKFFRITSTGYDTEAGDGAVRTIEAIYYTSRNNYVPLAYWTPGDIDFNGTSCVKRMSFFAGGNITDVIRGQGCNGTQSSPSGIIADRSQAALYRDWVQAPYNTTQRVGADGNPIISAGFGAVGLICGGSPGPSCNEPGESVANGFHDYDSTTLTKGRQNRFVNHAPNPTPGNQITFPFEEGNALENPSQLIDPGLLEEMAAAAGDQGTYFGAEGAYAINTWPADPGQDVRYFVDGRDGDGVDVTFNVDSCQGSCDPGEPRARGIIVVANGEFRFSNSSDGFEGVVIVIGTGAPDSGGVDNSGTYTQGGSEQLDGYAASSGDMTISGNVNPDTTIEALANLNSFTAVNFWSWRECYNTTCS